MPISVVHPAEARVGDGRCGLLQHLPRALGQQLAEPVSRAGLLQLAGMRQIHGVAGDVAGHEADLIHRRRAVAQRFTLLY